MRHPDLLQARLSFHLIFSILFIFSTIPYTNSILQCSSYAITSSMLYIDYDPLNPSSTTMFCTISLSNFQSIGAAGELIDSFDIIFNNFDSEYSLQFDGTSLEIGKIVSVTETIRLDVKRIALDRWEIYIKTVYPRSSGLYTFNIGGCNTSSQIAIEYIPKVLESTVAITLPPNSIELLIKCPIEKTLYHLFICNTITSDCVSNIPRVSYLTLDSDLFFYPPLSTSGLVENKREIILCQIVPLSGSFFRKSEFIISTTDKPFLYKNISINTGNMLNLTEYFQEYLQTIIIPLNNFKIIFSNGNDDVILPIIDNVTLDNTDCYFCTIQHEYFKTSMLVLNLTVLEIVTQKTTSISPNTTITTLKPTTLLTTISPTIITKATTVFEFPNYFYYLVYPGGGVTIFVICLCVCCCCLSCLCYRKYCSGRSRKFTADEISPPIPPRRENLFPAYSPIPELEIPLEPRTEFTFQRLNFDAGFEESVFSEIPVFRPHKDQTLVTEARSIERDNHAKGIVRQRSMSVPDFEKPPQYVQKLTPKRSSALTQYDISSTHPPSQSVSSDNLKQQEQQQPQNTNFLKPPVIHYHQRTRSAEAVQYSYGILPSPNLQPQQPIQTHTLMYVPVANVSPAYMPPQAIACIQTQNLTPILPHYPNTFSANFPPPSPVIYPGLPVAYANQPVTVQHQRIPSLQSQQQPLSQMVDDLPSTPTGGQKNTTININIINSKDSVERLPPGHFVDFL